MAGGVTSGSAEGWSKRFEEGLHPVIERFNASISFDITLLQEDLDGSIAHARMLGECGVISLEEAAQLEGGLEKIRSEAEAGEFQPGLVDEDVHFAVERRLIALLGPVGKKLHTGRSRNDQVGTDLRLWLRRRLDDLDCELERFQHALLTQAESHRQTLIPGYTHLQRAQPLCLAHHLLAYIEMIQRDRDRLKDVRGRVNISPLGAAALAGTSVPIDRQNTAAALGFECIYANSLDAVSDRDFAVEYTAAASLVMVHLSRLAEEVIFWASEEFAFVRLSDRCATGSSLMPQKKNPDVPELVRGKCGRVFGHLQGLLTMIKGLPLAYNRDLQEDKPALFDSFDTVQACLELAAPLVEETQLKRRAIESQLHLGHLDATNLMEYLIQQGVPQRTAHHITGQFVRIALDEGVSLAELPLEKMQTCYSEIDDSIYKVLGDENAVQSFGSYGSTAPDQVNEQLTRWQARLAEE